MTAASQYAPYGSRGTEHCGAPTRSERGEGRCRVGRNGYVHHTSRRGRGPSTQGKMRSTTSGRSSSQQGLTATCTDLVLRRQPRHEEGGGLAHESVGAKKAG